MSEVTLRKGSIQDLVDIHDVADAHARAIGEPRFTLAEVTRFWERDGFDPRRDAYVAVDGDGTVVGSAELHADHSALVRVDPSWDARGVHASLLDELERLARGRGLPALSAVVPETDAAACAAYERAGYALSREVWRMWAQHDREPPEPAFPAGITVRTYAPDDDEEVHSLLDEAYLGWDDAYVPVPHATWLSSMTSDPDFDAECWFLAEHDDELAGACLNWRQGWVKDLAVRAEWRRRGLGEALLRHTFRELWLKGVPRLGLKVDSTNATGAPRLYERLGFVTDRRYLIFTKPL